MSINLLEINAIVVEHLFKCNVPHNENVYRHCSNIPHFLNSRVGTNGQG